MAERLPERRYSDDETRRIFEEAARSHAASGPVAGEPAGSSGFTLEQLREIGREAGIDPANVDRAAANLDAVGATDVSAATRAVNAGPLGLPTTLHEERTVARRLTDQQMRFIGEQVQRIINRPGSLRQTGDWIEWKDNRDRIYVGVVRGDDRTRIRAIADQARALIRGSLAVSFITLVSAGSLTSVASSLAPLPQVVLAGGLAAGAGWLFWKWRTRIERHHMNELLDILEDSVS